MRCAADLRYDVTSATSQGRRDYQEDTVVMDFPLGSPVGFAVLSDGMGGHAAGDIASKIVATEVFSELKLQLAGNSIDHEDLAPLLEGAAQSANDCIGSYARNYPEAAGLGATLLAPVILGDRLSWISVGDSPLYLFRGDELRQLNEDHSMGPQIDHLVDTGVISLEAARNHPDRNCLTSVLGGRPIQRIDCPAEPLALLEGDLVIAASDGLQFLDNETIAAILRACRDRDSGEISAALLRALDDLDNPDQDNIAICVMRILAADALHAPHGGPRDPVAVLPGPVMRRPLDRRDGSDLREMEYLVGSMNDSNGSLTYCLSRTRRTA